MVYLARSFVPGNERKNRVTPPPLPPLVRLLSLSFSHYLPLSL
jgi:hypothetical protein